MQLFKEKDNDSSATFQKWFKNKVKKIAKNQIKDSIRQIKDTKYKSIPLGNYISTVTKSNLILKGETDEIIIPHSMITGTAIEGTCSIQLSIKDGRVYRLKNELKTNGLLIVNLINCINNTPYKF